MPAKPSIAVRILGQDYRIATDGSAAAEEQIQAAAALVDQTMRKIRERTGTVDTVGVAVLAALNLANQCVSQDGAGDALTLTEAIDPDRVRALIELVENAAAETPAA